MNQEIKDDDVVICTVKKIEGTTVFVEISDHKDKQGTIILPEIAAGRIRNLRDYVSPNKKIVCKVLKIYPDHIELTLRRVTGKERELALDKHKKERNLASMIKTITTDFEKILEKIKAQYEIPDFIEEARENPKLVEKFLPKEEAEKLSKILEEKKEKEKIVKTILTITSNSSSGLKDIKEILNIKEGKVSYLGSSKFSIEVQAKDFKTAEKTLSDILEKIETKAKKLKATLEIKEK